MLTRAVVYKMVGSVFKILYERIILKLIHIRLIMCVAKLDENRIADFVKFEGDSRFHPLICRLQG